VFSPAPLNLFSLFNRGPFASPVKPFYQFNWGAFVINFLLVLHFRRIRVGVSPGKNPMPENIHDIFRRKIVPVRFERTMGLLGATTLGVGALMGAGIYVLIGLAAGEVGPGAWLSYLICGLLSILSVLMFGELSRRVPVTGGGYAYAYNAIGSFWGFITGWLLALGSIFACAMYANGFAYYLTSILDKPVPEAISKGIAVIIIAVLTLSNCWGTKKGDRLQKFFTWGNLAVLLVLILFSLPSAEFGRLKPMFPKGFVGIGGAIAIIYVSFFGYQLIANNAEEIIDPTKTVPRAMLFAMIVSIAFYIAVALVSVMVVPWESLAGSKAPLVEVAVTGLGRIGWLLVVLGGVLASAAALNSTLMAQARQIFAMGKDRFLPAIVGRIHATYRTPTAALWAAAIITAVSVISADLTFIVKSANFCFLASLLPISLALRKLYRKPDTAAPANRFKRFIPELAFIANLSLLLTIDWVSLLFGLQLTAIGCFIYLFYSRRREIRSRTGMSVVLTQEEKAVFHVGSRILVPMSNPQTQSALFGMSDALLADHGGEIVVLTVVETPNQMDFYSALGSSEDSLQILDRSIDLPKFDRVRLKPVVRVSRNLAKGIVHAAEEEGCNLIVMGYAGSETSQSLQLIEEVLSHARTDTVLLKLRGEFAPKRIAVSLGSSLNLNLIVRLAGAVADRYSGEITFLNILPANYTAEQKSHSGKILVEAIQRHAARALYRIELASSDVPLEFLVKRSGEFDLLIVGTTKVGLLERVAVGSFSSQIVGRSECSVAVVKVARPVKKLLSV
jgi:APA family basic amino acid/polyamine antiporter